MLTAIEDPKLGDAECSNVIGQACPEFYIRCNRLSLTTYHMCKIVLKKTNTMSVCVASCLVVHTHLLYTSYKKCLQPLQHSYLLVLLLVVVPLYIYIYVEY